MSLRSDHVKQLEDMVSCVSFHDEHSPTLMFRVTFGGLVSFSMYD